MIRAAVVLSCIKPVLFKDLNFIPFCGKALSGHVASGKCSWLEGQMAGPNEVRGVAEEVDTPEAMLWHYLTGD